MSVGAAIRITSRDEERVIQHAASYAQQRGAACFIISVVRNLPYGVGTGDDLEVVQRNLALISGAQASAVMQEGRDIARTLLAVGRVFDLRAIFLQSGSSRPLGRSIAEQLLYLDPPFDVVIVGSE